jgi:hypothetical protein
MGESSNKLRSEIDLNEFERRLSGPAPSSATYEDPLAELARLVDGNRASGDQDPYRAMFAAPRAVGRGRAGVAPPATPNDHAFFAELRGSLDAPAASEFPPDVMPAPGLHAAEMAAPSHDIDPVSDQAAWAEEETDYSTQAYEAPTRSRRPLYAMAAIVCAGLAGIGTSLAMRSKASGPQELAMIKASSGPVKVQPEAPGGVDVPNQQASILDKSAGAPVTKVVSREEQPVDLDQTMKSMRVITLGGSRDGTVSSTGAKGAAAVPVPPPPSANVSLQNNGFPEPKRVKTVSVRPDGSVLGGGGAPVAPAPVARPAATAAATDSAALPKSSTPKSTARVATTPRIEAAAAPVADDPATTPSVSKPKIAAGSKPKAIKVASAEETPASDATQSTAAAGAAGGFSVQLAAPGSEQDARSMSANLAQKYADPLAGRHPSVVKATVGDKSIYRVRVASLSREAAVSLCEKIKAKGGACFVAKN